MICESKIKNFNKNHHASCTKFNNALNYGFDSLIYLNNQLDATHYFLENYRAFQNTCFLWTKYKRHLRLALSRGDGRMHINVWIVLKYLQCKQNVNDNNNNDSTDTNSINDHENVDNRLIQLRESTAGFTALLNCQKGFQLILPVKQLWAVLTAEIQFLTWSIKAMPPWFHGKNLSPSLHNEDSWPNEPISFFFVLQDICLHSMN